MSTLTVQNIQGSSSSSNTINVASGHKISGAAGSIGAPGQVVQLKTAFLGQGSNYGIGTDPNLGNHTYVTDGSAGANVDGDQYWEAHVITTTTTTPTASNWSIDITPTSATSIIKFEFNPHIHCPTSADAPGIRIVRTISGGTATVVYQPQTNTTGPYGLWYGAGGRYFQPQLSGYDKPNTTTSTNYKVYYYTYGGANVSFFGHPGNQWAPKQHFTVMEIAQ